MSCRWEWGEWVGWEGPSDVGERWSRGCPGPAFANMCGAEGSFQGIRCLPRLGTSHLRRYLAWYSTACSYVFVCLSSEKSLACRDLSIGRRSNANGDGCAREATRDDGTD